MEEEGKSERAGGMYAVTDHVIRNVELNSCVGLLPAAEHLPAAYQRFQSESYFFLGAPCCLLTENHGG